MKWAAVYSESPPKEKDSIAVPFFDDEIKKWEPGPFGFLHELVSSAIGTGDFEGKYGEMLATYPDSGFKRLFLLGLGKADDLNSTTLRRAFAKLGSRAREMNVQSITMCLPERVMKDIQKPICLVVEGFSDGQYRYGKYMKNGKKRIKGAMVLLPEKDMIRRGLEELRVAEVVADASIKAKDLSNEPPNIATPDWVSKQIRSWFSDSEGNVKVRILNRAKMEKLNLNLVLAVGSASANEPKMVIMEYKGGKAREKPIVLVGKGVTFDAGGLSLKVNGMGNMKQDMSGASAVAGAMAAASRLKLKMNLVGITPLVENLPGGSAYKVDDIIRSYSGKTVHVQNTDAEGRLILADALAYAVDMKPREIIDVATLTGSAINALGREAAAIMGNDREVLDGLKGAMEISGERVWELPMWKEYGKLVESKIADVKNIGEGRDAGSIVGGKFLENFVSDVPWVHVDIAPTMWDKDGFSRGYGVSLLVNYLVERSG